MGSSVRAFYDSVGWQKGTETYRDTELFADRRRLARRYDERYYARLRRALGRGHGESLLELGCGANPHRELAAGYGTFVCVDFSIVGLREARAKLDGKPGGCVLADATALPFADDHFDAVISAHMLQHVVGLDNQVKVLREVYRTLRPGHRAVVTYVNPYHTRYFDFSTGWSALPPILRALFYDTRAMLHGRPHWWVRVPHEHELIRPGHLYSKVYPLPWVRRWLPRGALAVRVGRLVRQDFTRRRIADDSRFGAMGLRLLAWLEDRFPRLLAWIAHYVLIVVQKPPQPRVTGVTAPRRGA